MTFGPIGRYLVDLLPPFLARGGDESEQALLLGVIGDLLDKVKAMVAAGRRLLFPQTSQGAALDLLGDARRWPRIEGQTDDEYRWFVTRAFELWQEGGTVPGLERALKLLGLSSAQVYEHHEHLVYLAGHKKLDGTWTLSEPGDNWALFDVVLEAAQWSLDETFKARVRAVVGRMKAARSKLARVRCSTALTLDGTWNLDGTALLDGQTRFWT